MVCLSRQNHFNFFKGCLPQVSLGPFLNTLSHSSITFLIKINHINHILCDLGLNRHCVKIVHIGRFSDSHFPTFGLNTERFSVSLHIQSECGKIRTRKTPNTDTIHAVLFFSSSYFQRNFSLSLLVRLFLQNKRVYSF